MRNWWIFVLALVGAFWALWAWYPKDQAMQDADQRVATPAQESPALPNLGTFIVTKKLPKPRATSSPGVDQSESEALIQLKEKLGSEIHAEFNSGGQLVSLKGHPRFKAANRFHSSDPQQAIARAKEILQTLNGELGLDGALPLADPIAKGGSASAQVYFQEKYEGLPVRPNGRVLVDLDERGDLIRLDSDYVRGLTVSNKAQITLETARIKALGAVPGVDSSSRVTPGKLIIWVFSNDPSLGTAQGRYAYDFSIGGHQVVVDASDGAILLNKDHRRH